MTRRFKSPPVPSPDAHGHVEVTIAGQTSQLAWRLHGDQVCIVSPVGQAYAARRDPGRGSVEDQARGMAIELWLSLARRR